MQENQGGSGFTDPLPEPQKAGFGNIAPWAIFAGVAVVGLIIVLSRRPATQAIPAV